MTNLFFFKIVSIYCKIGIFLGIFHCVKLKTDERSIKHVCASFHAQQLEIDEIDPILYSHSRRNFPLRHSSAICIFQGFYWALFVCL